MCAQQLGPHTSQGKYRTYTRKFDHEQAIRRHAAGESISDIARGNGVSYNAVQFVVDPVAAAHAANLRAEYNSGTCEVCGGDCHALTAAKRQHNRDGRSLCNRCRSDERITRLRFTDSGALLAVRCSMLDCANGERWQPPENFSRGGEHREVRDGGIHGTCRACSTRMRQRYRLSKRVPCVNCGEPRLPASEKGTRYSNNADTGLCLACYQASHRKAA